MTIHRRHAGVAVGTCALLAIGAVVELRPPATPWPSATVRSQPFVDAIVESGAISAQQLMLYSSSITGMEAKLAEIVPEGTNVSAGDVLLRFDTTPFEQARATELAALRQAEADLQRATEDARVAALRAEGEEQAARQQIINAENALKNETDGRGRVTVVEVEAALAEAGRELERTQRAVDDLAPLLSENFITRAEMAHAEQARDHAADQLRLARSRRDSLVAYERPAAMSRAEAELGAARDALGRQRETATARSAAQESAVRIARSRVDELAGRVAILTSQIERATVRAGGPGLVVYRDLFFGSDRRKPQVGDEIFPNQPLIALPDSSQLVVDTRVREVDLHKVFAGQKVDVRVDAYPDLRLAATVAFVGALAQDDATRAGTKYFPVTVKLSVADARLRTGMTARVAIEVTALPSALMVPLQAVFDDNGQRYVLVVRNGRPERRLVTVATENDSMAAISSGLSAGEAVLLVDPTAGAR